MSRNTEIVSRQCMLQKWSQIVNQKSSSGLSVKDFCRQQGITINQYFYWLRKVKEAVLDISPGIFAELPKINTAPSGVPGVTLAEPAVVIHIGNISVDINDNASASVIRNVLEAINA